MHSFPMFIRTTNRRVVIAGGGEQAAQKARLMLKTDAHLTFLAEDLDAELADLVRTGRARQERGPITARSFADTAMTFIATSCPGVDVCLHTLAKAGGAAVNVVDQPALCDMTTPSIVDRDPVVVAIGTEGTAPVLARQIKTQLERMLDPRLGSFAALAGRLRGAVAAQVPRADRRAFWRWAFAEAPWHLHKTGSERAAADLLKQAIAGQETPAQTGHIALVGAGPGARDLLTLRAVERLQEADVIFYDRLVDPEVLELARRDAERVYVGKVVGAHAWPQDRICALIVAEAAKGRRVVRLKSGDPCIFGRATEELDAAHAVGIEVEIVPGVTAASAAAASMGRSLTQRGQTDALVLATGRHCDRSGAPDWARHALPGTTLVFYMGVGAAAQIGEAIRTSGLPEATRVTIAASVSRADQKVIETSLVEFAVELERRDISGNALILLTIPADAELSKQVGAVA
ncbi:uroporphyrin-III C-methyltransferase / precorrin-2 dehydrogenase / sirohydrochlorin ferrochelatase [Jannaschia faecimaris]|uniref:Uroporphyrin-III C-methyltransferase / precorrin-2 dehydrogenase / sirohydrochlorin ferrochelatase n=2 Tax=Jannaschia faecimaris TaxID=1244108 RepID=A0A1H3UBI1_9RHOB|nr:uroporphyrin-III C-methyltransferase / precorrin-2 dehydrogenase / sirohydrochlorin ferrochelatase [Jannaschia faecimaris]